MGHPDREPLLETARPFIEHPGADFRVVRLWASDRWGFLCALGEYKDGRLTELGGNTELFVVALKRTFGGWEQASVEVRFVADLKTVGSQCRLRDQDTTKALSDHLIETALRTPTFNEESEGAFQAEHDALQHYLAGRDKEALASYGVFLKAVSALKYPAEEIREAFDYKVFLAHGRLAVIYQRQKRNDLRDAHLRESLKHQSGTMNLKKPAEVLKYVAGVDSNYSKK